MSARGYALYSVCPKLYPSFSILEISLGISLPIFRVTFFSRAEPKCEIGHEYAMKCENLF